MRRLSVLSAILLSSTALHSSVVQAQETREPFLLDQVTVTSTKTEETVIDSPSSSSVVSAETLEIFQPDDVSEIFRGVPGVETQTDGTDPSTAINIRGLQDFGRVNVLIEGARQDFQRSGHGPDGMFYLEPELIKQVDITRGPGAVVYGSGAIGGVVNFELKDASDILSPDERMGGVIKASYDTNDEGILLSGIGAIQEDNFDILGNVVWRQDENYSDGNGNEVNDTGEEIVSGLVKAKFRPGEGHEFTAIASIFDATYETGPTFATNNPVRDSETRSTNLIGKWNFESPDNPLIDVSANVYYTNTQTDQVRRGTMNARSFEIDTYGFDLFNTSRFEAGAFSHELTYGIDGFLDEVEVVDPGGTGALFTPSGERTVFGGFVQDKAQYQEWLEIIAALRFDSYELDGTGGLNLEGTNVSPKLTVAVTPVEGIQFFATYAEGFRAPAITEVFNAGSHPPPFVFDLLPNTNLKPEEAENVEFGVNLKQDGIFSEDDRFRAKIVYFDNSIENYIEGRLTFMPPPATSTFQYVNVAQAEISGLEIEASYEVGNFFSSLAYSNIRGDDVTANQPLTSIRPEKFSATAGLRFLDDTLIVGGRVTAVAKQNRAPASVAANLVGNSYELVDLFLNYAPDDRSSYGIVLNNITDEHYQKYLDENFSEGFSATITAKFKL